MISLVQVSNLSEPDGNNKTQHGADLVNNIVKGQTPYHGEVSTFWDVNRFMSGYWLSYAGLALYSLASRIKYIPDLSAAEIRNKIEAWLGKSKEQQ